MGRLRLGRTGAGLFRLHRGSGKHAGARVDGAPTHARHAFDPLTAAPLDLRAPLTWTAPPPAPAPPPVPAQVQPAVPAPTVSLVLRDGRQLTLDAGDPRARTFVTVASEMLRFVPADEITRSG